ncbi:hypothetical protein [Terricaulis sp.]|uniref:hypothetical protein n=1 Tax=Terricaulis sp. TaxID=2768686 RepID=UPI003783F639
MKRTFSAALAAIVLAATALAPAAEARDHHGRGGRDGYYDGRGHGGDRHYRGGRYYGRGDYYYRDRDHGDAVAAGAIGLVLGLALGSALSQDQNGPGCRERCPRGDGYYQRDQRYADPRYGDDRYDEGGSAYEEDYGGGPPPRSQCTRRERQWDRYANRYVTVDVPC